MNVTFEDKIDKGGPGIGVVGAAEINEMKAAINSKTNSLPGSTPLALVQLDSEGKLPALDGSKLLGLPGGGNIDAGSAAGQVPQWDEATQQYLPATPIIVIPVSPLAFDRVTGQLTIDTSGLGGSGSFAFDTFPQYIDSPHTSGVAVSDDGTLAALYVIGHGWMTFALSSTLSATPQTYTMTLTISDPQATGDSFTINGETFTADTSPVSVYGLSSATTVCTYNGTHDASFVGTGVTGSSPNWLVDMTADRTVSAAISNLAADITDDFSSDTITSGAWIKDSGAWTIAGGVLVAPSGTAWVYLRNATPVASVDQYAKVTLPNVPTGTSAGFVFRCPGATGYKYLVKYEEANHQIRLAYANGTGSALNILSILTSLTLSPGDSFGVTVQGTGASRTWKVWVNPTAAKPYNANNWDSSNDPADGSFVGGNSNVDDTGLYIGLTSTGMSQQFDDFSGGSL